MKKGWIVFIVVLFLAAAGVTWQFLRPAATVTVIHPTRGTIRAYVDEQAVTELPHDYLVAMPINGWLEPITLREGDTVTEGQLVATLDKSDLEDRVRQAEQRIKVLETKLARTGDHRLEENALVEAEATVKAMNETVSAAEEKLKAYRAVRDYAQTEYERISRLHESGQASDTELHRATMEYRQAEGDFQSDALELAALKTLAAVSYIGPKFIRDYIDRKSFEAAEYERELASARAEAEIEQRNLARAEIHSPIAGVVLNRHNTRRQFLAAGTPLLTLGRLEDLEINAEVLTERAVLIEPGNDVDVIAGDLTAAPLHGTVTRVWPAGFKKISSLGVEQQRVNVTIRLDKRPERLGVEFRVNVRIYYAHAENALILPRTAIIRSADGGWQMIVVRDRRARLTDVTLGLRNDDYAEVTAGLSAADAVVAQPAQDIADGTRVAVEPDTHH